MSKRKARSNEGPNSDICELLSELAEYEKNVNRNIHKYNAYRKAASSLAQHPKRITSGKEAKALSGVGQKIADKIDEFLKTGKISKLQKLRASDDSVAINLLAKVSGIGPATAKKFVDQGIKTIEDLKKHEHLLNHHQKIGLKYFKDFEKKIPRDEMEVLEDIIVKEIKGLDRRYIVTICGSYRRGAEESGDIDILLTHKDYMSTDKKKPVLLRNVVEKLEEADLIVDQISCGDTKFMGVCRLKEKDRRNPYRRIDIRIFPHDQYYCATLYFTGSNLFNQRMREHALQEGFTLNEYCIRRLGTKGTPGEEIFVNSEEEIFDYINYPYKKPEERNM